MFGQNKGQFHNSFLVSEAVLSKIIFSYSYVTIDAEWVVLILQRTS